MGEKQEKMLVLWLRINKSPKAKQVSNIHRIATVVVVVVVVVVIVC
jgi:hypothetical protein